MAHAEHKNEHICLELVDDAAKEEAEEVGSGDSGSGSTPPAAPSTGGSSTGGDEQVLIKGIGIQGK